MDEVKNSVPDNGTGEAGAAKVYINHQHTERSMPFAVLAGIFYITSSDYLVSLVPDDVRKCMEALRIIIDHQNDCHPHKAHPNSPGALRATRKDSSILFSSRYDLPDSRVIESSDQRPMRWTSRMETDTAGENLYAYGVASGLLC